jgi:hypothetical protein
MTICFFCFDFDFKKSKTENYFFKLLHVCPVSCSLIKKQNEQGIVSRKEHCNQKRGRLQFQSRANSTNNGSECENNNIIAGQNCQHTTDTKHLRNQLKAKTVIIFVSTNKEQLPWRAGL